MTPAPVRPAALSRLTLALLAAAVALSGVLAVQAQRAARSHRATAERTLRAYAAMTAWEVAGHARQDMLAANHVLFALVGNAALRRAGRGDATPCDVDSVALLLREQAAACGGCVGGVGRAFRLDFRDGTFDATDDADAATRRWIRDTVAALIPLLPDVAGGPASRPAPLVVRERDGVPRVRGYTVTNVAQGVALGRAGGAPVLLLYLVLRADDGTPVTAYGFLTPPDAYVRPLFSRILAKRRLLPPALAGGLPVDSLLSLTVSDAAGRPAFRSAAAFDSTYGAVETLEPRYGALRLGVALNPDAAGRLIIGGLPRSRLPILITLFAVTAGLVGVALVQLRRQQALVRMRADFVSAVSHELRTPLAQIRLLAELLHMGKPDAEAARRRSARIIDQEARRLTYLVENILAFSRGERGTTRLVPVAVDLGAEVADVIEMFAPLAAAEGSRVELRADPDTRAAVDSAALRQVLLNLLDNANRYGPRGQCIRVGVERAGAAARVWVEDEGPGVPRAERTRVWQPYYRLERDAGVAAGGSGIGLAVVRDLVRSHGGRAWIESAPGHPDERRGARFVVELPGGPVTVSSSAWLTHRSSPGWPTRRRVPSVGRSARSDQRGATS